jgi:pimeloyl-ACP methyl ester carboxylesterase
VAGTLPVPGAVLHYQVLGGTGPLLLILSSGGGDADSGAALAGHLAGRYTVVSYDRRGLSRSLLHDSEPTPDLRTHGDDAHRLLTSLSAAPALVFGCSIGAVIGLDLALRYPGSIQALVAHEPPVPALLPPPGRAAARRAQREVERAYRAHGRTAAMRAFLAHTGAGLADREPDVPWARPAALARANADFFLAHDTGAVRRYELEPAALAAATARILPAGGSTSRQVWTHRCAIGLARRLGTPLTEFPGGHEGYLTHPRGFAARLRELLSTGPAPLRSPAPTTPRTGTDPRW